MTDDPTSKGANLPAIPPPVGITTEPGARQAPAITRDASGRFLAGNGGGGRRIGQRNRLTELFVARVAQDFEDHGAAALASLRVTDPASYLRIVAQFVPRELVLQREREPDYSDLTDEEVAELHARRKRHHAVRTVLNEGERRP